MKIKKMYDVSLIIKTGMLMWPGEDKPVITPKLNIKEDGCNVSNISMSCHTGTHVDSPKHFLKYGLPVDKEDLTKFIGKAHLIKIKNDVISFDDIKDKSIKEDSIVLFKTNNTYKKTFDKKAVSLSKEAAEFLIKKKVKSIGIDYLSIERWGEDHSIHKRLLENNMGIIEGLDFQKVPEGEYVFVSFPLRICGVEASPCRAVLLKY